MRKKTICALVTALIISSTTAFAAVKVGGYSVSPLIGGFVYDNDQQFNANLVLGVRAGYNITKEIGVEALYDYVIPTDSKFWSISNITLHRFGGEALYHFFPDNQLVPYLAAGVSGVKFNGNGLNPDLHGSVDYGAGAKYFVADDIAVRSDVRHIMYGYNGKTYNNFEFTIGAFFQFGGVTPAAKVLTTATQPLPGTVADACTPAPEPEACVPVACAPVACAPEPVSIKIVNSPVTREACEPLWAAIEAQAASQVVVRRPCEKSAAVTVLYGSDRVIFKVDYQEELDKIGNFLKEFPNSKVTVIGHTDSSGSKEENLQLSLVRAGVLRSHIMYKFKIDRSRIAIKGYGASRPVASNRTEAGKSRNRRVEFIFSCD